MSIENINKIEKKIFCFDSHNLIYRSYFAVPKFHDKHNRPTGAIQGTCSILLKYLYNYPNALYCIASDSKGGNFRHQLFDQYKIHRKEIEDELLQQIILMPKFYEAFGLNILANHGFEADDYIASVVKKFSPEYTIFIISSDKDLMQLINDKVFLIEPTKEILVDSAAVREKFGVMPSQIKDYLSLVGDASDNIPGAKLVGPKKAVQILSYGNLDDSLNNPALIKEIKLQELVIKNYESIKLSQQLVTLKDDLEINIDPEKMTFDFCKTAQKLHEIFGEYDLYFLQKRIEKFLTDPEETIIKNEEIIEQLSKEMIFEIQESGIIAINSDQEIFFNNRSLILKDMQQLKIILEDDSIKKIVFDAYNIEKTFNIELKGIYDLSIIYYHLIGTKANSDIKNIDGGKNFIQLYQEGINKLFANKHLEFFEEDRIIYHILRNMEKQGILIDKEKLNELAVYFEKILFNIKEQIIDSTGYDFNILSPKQTSDVLFNKLELKPGKKSKNEGVYSTSTKVLEELASQGFEAADQILQYRSFYKLKSSYCDGLINEINQQTGRIHTKFSLNGANTGRILSSKPNLQSIPTKTEEGKKIRGCFIAKSGYKLISADYSQIELRILSHIANVQNLKDAFANDIDIHQLTASEVFNIPLEKVDNFWRSKAKAVNFGIIYGISPFGLSRQLKISTGEAAEIIKSYLSRYHEIHKYLENTKEFALKNNYVKTMFGRHCYLASVDDLSNHFEKQNYERIAINAPLQGTASDIIKKAMIAINKFLQEKSLGGKLLLQIHDELIFEAPDNEIDEMVLNIKNIMENAGEEINMKLKVDVGVGQSWFDL